MTAQILGANVERGIGILEIFAEHAAHVSQDAWETLAIWSEGRRHREPLSPPERFRKAANDRNWYAGLTEEQRADRRRSNAARMRAARAAMTEEELAIERKRHAALMRKTRARKRKG